MQTLQSGVVSAYHETKSIRAISRQTGLSREKVRNILVKNRIKLLTNDEAIVFANRTNFRKFFGDSDHDKAYLYGFVLGDVHVFKKSKFTLRAITHSTRRCFVDLFVKEFSTYGKVNCKFTKNKEWRLFVDLDYESFKFLEQRNDDCLPQWINRENFLSFFAGFVDSDGSVLIRKAGKYFQYVVKVFGQNTYILSQIKQYLAEMGFSPCLNKVFSAGRQRIWKGRILRYNKDYYALEIYRKDDTLKLLNNLNLRHKEKIVRKGQLLEICKTKLIHWNDIKEAVIKLRKQIEEEAPEVLEAV